jgi:serralysin
MQGTSKPDKMSELNGNDEMIGGQKDDEFGVCVGNCLIPPDSFSGGEGNDTIWGAAGNDDISGDAGSDKMNGKSGNDKISGGQDNDTLIGEMETMRCLVMMATM